MQEYQLASNIVNDENINYEYNNGLISLQLIDKCNKWNNELFGLDNSNIIMNKLLVVRPDDHIKFIACKEIINKIEMEEIIKLIDPRNIK